MNNSSLTTYPAPLIDVEAAIQPADFDMETAIRPTDLDVEAAIQPADSGGINVEAPQPGKIVYSIATFALSQIAADSYSFKNLLLPFLLSHVNADPEHTAAIALIVSLVNLTIVGGTSLLFSIKIQVSVKLAELNRLVQDSDEWNIKRLEIADLYRNSLILATSIIPIPILAMTFSGPLFHQVLQQNKQIAYIAQDFLRQYAIIVPGIIYVACLKQMISGFRCTTALAWTNKSILLGLPLAILLIFFTKLGAWGIVVGFALESYCTAGIYFYFTLFHPDFNRLKLGAHLFSDLSGNRSKFFELVRLALPISLIQISEIGLNFCLSTMTGILGTANQEAFAMTMQYTLANFLIYTNVSVASALAIAKPLGEQRNQDVYLIARYGLAVTTIFSMILPLSFAIYPKALMSILSNHNQSAGQKLTFLAPIISIGSLLDGSSYAFMLQLRTIKDFHGVMIYRLTSTVLGAVLAIVLGLYTKLGLYGVAMGYASAMLLSFGSLGLRWYIKMQPYRESERETYLDSTTENSNLSQAYCSCSFFATNHKNTRRIPNEESSTNDQVYDTVPDSALNLHSAL